MGDVFALDDNRESQNHRSFDIAVLPGVLDLLDAFDPRLLWSDLMSRGRRLFRSDGGFLGLVLLLCRIADEEDQLLPIASRRMGCDLPKLGMVASSGRRRKEINEMDEFSV